MRAAEAGAPLTDAEIATLFAPLVGAERVALAVSGGANSMALLAAIEGWRAARPALDALVLTVDHGLQKGSRDEARRVAAAAHDRGFRATVLTWEGTKPTGDIEAAARLARYRLLTAAARQAGASHLLLAHSRDDQAETFLMRLERGSGVFGLAAMPREMPVDGLILFRPFLGIPRARLRATTVAAGLAAVEDRMNADARFLRPRIRRLMPDLAAAGIDPAALAGAASRLAEAAEALDGWADRLIGETVAVDAFAVATLARTAFLAAPATVRARLLVRLLQAIGGEPYPPRYERLESLHQALAGPSGAFAKRTLAGVVIEPRGSDTLFYREAGREGLPEIAAGPGFAGAWDRRFAVEIGADAPAGLILSALGEEGRRTIGARVEGRPAAAIAALPALRAGNRIVSAPSLDWWEEDFPRFAVAVSEIVGRRLAAPSRFPSFAES